MNFSNNFLKYLREDVGQSSVEAMLLFAVVLVICIACWMFFSAASDGRIQMHHIDTAAHILEGKAAEGIQDVLLY